MPRCVYALVLLLGFIVVAARKRREPSDVCYVHVKCSESACNKLLADLRKRFFRQSLPASSASYGILPPFGVRDYNPTTEMWLFLEGIGEPPKPPSELPDGGKSTVSLLQLASLRTHHLHTNHAHRRRRSGQQDLSSTSKDQPPPKVESTSLLPPGGKPGDPVVVPPVLPDVCTPSYLKLGSALKAAKWASTKDQFFKDVLDYKSLPTDDPPPKVESSTTVSPEEQAKKKDGEDALNKKDEPKSGDVDTQKKL
eukprot:gnl/Spiro4/8686_TR4542_c0_g1_i1.p1 gnl/Spiro4/8686_TR4542_c0_g1~~gnl/Spiro4/8686_TR4542_c0_g1_i1.p1  ORF type:complete len:253 (+),score=47.61 gnl/Spiro4/8686_TR4542_c0_g1_i1:93-851(+)